MTLIMVKTFKTVTMFMLVNNIKLEYNLLKTSNRIIKVVKKTFVVLQETFTGKKKEKKRL